MAKKKASKKKVSPIPKLSDAERLRKRRDEREASRKK